MKKPFELHLTARVGARFTAHLRKRLKQAHGIVNPPLRELSVALVNDRHMSDLHLQFMNIPGPTDVLTFPLDLDQRGKVLSGEVVICVPEARRRAKIEGVALENELLLYGLHGLLHLCGYDDRTDREFRRMHAMEDRILENLGVGALFAPRSAIRKRVTR